MARQRNSPFLPQPPAPGAPFFLVKITAASSGNYSFDEWWLDSTNTAAKKEGGRYAGAANPGRAVTGATFAVGEFALCRQAEGAGGLTWELYPVGSPSRYYRVDLATTQALPSCTYANGVGGVGATLTATANGAFPTIDGGSLPANTNYSLLVKDQAGAAQNGVYSLTQQGDATHSWVLTRRAGLDTSGALKVARFGVTSGDTGQGTLWETDVTIADPVMGTDGWAFTDIGGTVRGPATSVGGRVPVFNSTNGKLIAQSGVSIDGGNVVSGFSQLTFGAGAVTLFPGGGPHGQLFLFKDTTFTTLCDLFIGDLIAGYVSAQGAYYINGTIGGTATVAGLTFVGGLFTGGTFSGLTNPGDGVAGGTYS